MPIHLPPLSRRAFLEKTLLAGVALAAGPAALAASRKQSDPDLWALLADTHIAADRAMVAQTVNMTSRFETVAREILALPTRPAGVIVTGDVAYNKGEPGDYQTMMELLEPVRGGQLPIHLLLGNHDQRAHFETAAKVKTGGPVKDKHVALVKAARANWFLLDSLETTNNTPGLLGPAQLEWLAAELDKNRKKPALVAIHHNPGTQQNINGLKDTEALLEILRPRKHVKAYFYGHTHHWQIEQDPSGIHLINLPPTAYIFRAGDPAGWVQATLQRQGIRLELRALDPSHPAHGQVRDLEWRAG